MIAGREVIKECKNHCMICKKSKAALASQFMAPLSQIRLKFNIRALGNVGIDFARPVLTKQGQGKTRNKRYFCLFTCLSSKAVHLEMLLGLDTTAFLNGFYRMINRRGVTMEVITGNGGCFVAVNEKLKELVSHLDEEKIKEATSLQKIKWPFNLPFAPQFGSVFEIMIKSTKRAVYDQLKNADINDEELLSAFAGAEGLINSRPLTYQSADARDVSPITQNHFLFGRLGGQFAPDVEEWIYYGIKRRWRLVQFLVKHFWKCWMLEFIPTLNRGKKWQSVRQNVEVGEIVLVISADVPCGQ